MAAIVTPDTWEEVSPMSDHVCDHCGFAADTHASHCPVFRAAIAGDQSASPSEPASTSPPLHLGPLRQALAVLLRIEAAQRSVNSLVAGGDD